MEKPIKKRRNQKRSIQKGTITKRHVLFHPGMEPRGAKSYYLMLKRAISLEKRQFGYDVTVSALKPLDNGNLHTRIRWQDGKQCCETIVEYQDTSDLFAAFLKQSIYHRIIRSFRLIMMVMVDFFVPRATLGFARKSLGQALWLFYMFCYPFLMIAAAVLVSALTAWGIVSLLPEMQAIQMLVPLFLTGVFTHLIFMVYQRHDMRLYIFFLLSIYVFRFEVLSGRRPDFIDRLNSHSARLKQVIETTDADEIVVASHCQGGVWGAWTVADYLQHPKKGHPPLKLITAGAPHWIAWYGFARKLRKDIDCISRSDHVVWMDYFMPQDLVAPCAIHPYDTVDHQKSGSMPNPTRLSARLSEAQPAEKLAGQGFDLFKTHFMYLAANETGRGTDYTKMLICPDPVDRVLSEDDWQKRAALFTQLAEEKKNDTAKRP